VPPSGIPLTMIDVINYLSQRGILLQPGAEKILEAQESPETAACFIEEHYVSMGEPVLAFPSSQELQEVLDGMPAKIASREAASRSVAQAAQTITVPGMDISLPGMDALEVVLPTGILKWKSSAREFQEDLKIDFDITGNSTCTGKLEDFVKYFGHRFETLKAILEREQKHELVMPVSIRTARTQEYKFRDEEFQIIGIVRKINVSAKKNVILELEDETGEIRVMDIKGRTINPSQVVPDEVIAVSGTMMPRTQKYPAAVMANRIIYPDVPMGNRPNRAKHRLYAAFMSDIHVGSKTFLRKEWDRFIEWINGRTDYRNDIASRIKYLVLPGDLVDGIGIFPGQEEELAVLDIFDQYRELVRLLSDIPDHIRIIISPGNHDAVRMAEPQPAFIPEVARILEENLPNAKLVGNPCKLRLHGVRVLAYHGKSMDDFITTMSRLTYDTPMEIMKEMLRRRHLVPVYGKRTPIAPEARDHLVIDDIPDIFVTGHVHSAGIDRHRGVLLINASTWQDQTSYQKMMNFVPDYAKLPVVNLKTLKPEMLDFTGPVS